MNVLEKIIAFKRNELERIKSAFPVSRLERSPFFNHEMPSLVKAIEKPGPSIIGEFKRKSPSRGLINDHSEIEAVTRDYEKAGIDAISILTDKEFFGGENNDLQKVAGFSKLAILRKDFIVDEYQVIESKSIGAGAILLIASVLSKNEILSLTMLASDLGLDVLFEIHDKEDLEKLNDKIRIVGVNNRNLKTSKVSLDNSIELIADLPAGCLKVAESGFNSCSNVNQLYESGYDAFLIGENFMRSADPGETAKEFIDGIRRNLK
jgi:indole-3-glycerol phosphate synthase